MNYFGIVALTTFVITLVLILGALKVFPKLGLLDRPERYGLSRKPIPYYGGVLVFLAVVGIYEQRIQFVLF